MHRRGHLAYNGLYCYITAKQRYLLDGSIYPDNGSVNGNGNHCERENLCEDFS